MRGLGRKEGEASGEGSEVDAVTDPALVREVDAAARDLVGAYDQAGGGSGGRYVHAGKGSGPQQGREGDEEVGSARMQIHHAMATSPAGPPKNGVRASESPGSARAIQWSGAPIGPWRAGSAKTRPSTEKVPSGRPAKRSNA